MIDHISLASGGKPADKSDWGDSPYPQGYYDIQSANEILGFANTSRQGIIDNIVDASKDVGNFLQFYKPTE